jgi:hypothetical protein
VLISLLGALLPFAALGVVVWLLVRTVRRRRARTS